MNRVRTLLALSFLTFALVLFAVFATNALTFPIAFLFRDAPVQPACGDFSLRSK
ncbi:MAG TPA: hypothetical protein VFD70_02620 [Anaerolineae bacterium]|nr:hypothetical protein [Anaerolineae bacterium]